MSSDSDQKRVTFVTEKSEVQQDNRIPDIIYREKRNPLTSTRLSCYKPKLSEQYSLPHCKSVDDFMFLNADDTTTTYSDYSADTAALIGADCAEDGKLNRLTKIDGPNLHGEQTSNEPKTVNADTNETYGFSATKSTEDNLNCNNTTDTVTMSSKKKMGPAYLSERFKSMSHRTQKIFSRLYNHNIPNVKDNSPHRIFDIKPKPLVVVDQSKASNNRRSLSYGNLPSLDEFQRNVTLFDSNIIKIDIKEPASDDYLIISDDKNHKDLLAEDADSGILVSESGQSSIVVVEPEELQKSGDVDVAENLLKCEYKLVELHLDDDDIDRNLRVVVSPRHFDNGKRLGYQVSEIIPGGLIDR